MIDVAVLDGPRVGVEWAGRQANPNTKNPHAVVGAVGSGCSYHHTLKRVMEVTDPKSTEVAPVFDVRLAELTFMSAL